MNRLTIGPLLFTGSVVLVRSLASYSKYVTLSTLSSISTPQSLQQTVPDFPKKVTPPFAKKLVETIYFGKNIKKPDEYRGSNPMDPPIVCIYIQFKCVMS